MRTTVTVLPNDSNEPEPGVRNGGQVSEEIVSNNINCKATQDSNLETERHQM